MWMLDVERSTSPDNVTLSRDRNGVPLTDFIFSTPLTWKVFAASDLLTAATITVSAPPAPALGPAQPANAAADTRQTRPRRITFDILSPSPGSSVVPPLSSEPDRRGLMNWLPGRPH